MAAQGNKREFEDDEDDLLQGLDDVQATMPMDDEDEEEEVQITQTKVAAVQTPRLAVLPKVPMFPAPVAPPRKKKRTAAVQQEKKECVMCFGPIHHVRATWDCDCGDKHPDICLQSMKDWGIAVRQAIDAGETSEDKTTIKCPVCAREIEYWFRLDKEGARHDRKPAIPKKLRNKSITENAVVAIDTIITDMDIHPAQLGQVYGFVVMIKHANASLGKAAGARIFYRSYESLIKDLPVLCQQDGMNSKAFQRIPGLMAQTERVMITAENIDDLAIMKNN